MKKAERAKQKELVNANKTNRIMTQTEEFGLKTTKCTSTKNVFDNIGRGYLVYVHNSYTSKQIDLKHESPDFEEAIYTEIQLNNNEALLCACLYNMQGESEAMKTM